jgi:hypothetical protein
MAATQRWRWKIAVVQWGLEVVWGGGLRLHRQRRAAAVTEEHVTMVLASALSKLKAYHYDVGVSVSKDGDRVGWELRFLVLISGTPIVSGIPILFSIPKIPVGFFLKFLRLQSQKIRIPICNIWNPSNLFAQELTTSHCC